MGNKMQVAQTIANQIGHKAIVMMGIKDMAGTENSLTFKIGSNAGKVTHIKIALNCTDTYDMTFFNVRGIKIKELATISNAYNNQIVGIIESKTGMRSFL